MKEEILELILDISKGDAVSSLSRFKDIMAEKANERLTDYKNQLASELFKEED